MLHPGKPNVSKADLTEALARRFKVKDARTIVIFGFRTAFGGGKSTGFALIYDTLDDVKLVEPKYRLVRVSSTDFVIVAFLVGAHIHVFLLIEGSPDQGRNLSKADQGIEEPKEEGPRYQEGFHWWKLGGIVDDRKILAHTLYLWYQPSLSPLSIIGWEVTIAFKI